MEKKQKKERARKAVFMRSPLHSRVVLLACRATGEVGRRISQESIMEAALAVPDDVIIKRVKQAARV